MRRCWSQARKLIKVEDETEKKLIVGFGVLLSICHVFGQGAGEQPVWAPKYEPAQYPAGHKPQTKLKDVLAKHKGQASWSETVVNDDHLRAEWVMMPANGSAGPRLHPDTRAWWVVMDGQVRFEIEGQQPFVAGKGSMVQVPAQTIYSMKTVGDKPSLRFEVNIAKAKTFYPQDVKPPELAKGGSWIPVVFGRKAQPYGYENKPHINLYELQKDAAYKGSRFVHDDRAVSMNLWLRKEFATDQPNDKGITIRVR
ncbi:MAG: cupin domain-containing protein [Bryobacteraceae bacterium]